MLASANYCVICGIRLPDRSQVEVIESAGWDTPRPAEPILPVEIPEFDELTGVDPRSDLPVESSEDQPAETFEAIPAIDLDELDAFIALDPVASNDELDGEITEEELEIDDMIEEGGPVFEGAPETIEDEPNEPATEAINMIDEGAPIADDESTEILEVVRIEAVIEVEEMVSEGGPVVETEPGDDEPDAGIVSDEEAIEMIDEGGPAFEDETAPEPADDDDTEVDQLAAAVLMHEPDPAPMISASYPESEIPVNDAVRLRPGEQYWWSVDSDDAWGDFAPLHQTTAPVPPATPDVAAKPADPEALERVQALLDELRELLPQLGQVRTEAGPNLSELRSIAIAARGERSFDDWAALRTVSAMAVGRPTDIDTILQLSKRVDDIAALIAERDRLQGAFAKIVDWIDKRNGA
ncbi:MAG: hypothetical protein IT334_05240 [Thermomicrobiales bacterium]|nr:hypothetical protein [Thermomicrobiales bacterium]